MIRVVIYLVSVGIVALGVAWIADRPGDVAITWQGLRIETSLMVMLVAIIIVIVLAMGIWSILRAILHSPDSFSLFMRNRRGVRGYAAISRGLVAIGSGDARAARKYADEARRIAPGEPLTLLLSAQAAQLSGEQGTAERTFRAMAGREDTKLLGLHGLFTEARRRNDMMAARLYAEEAAKTSPTAAWAGHAVLDFRCAAGDWLGALDVVERNYKSGLIEKAVWRRQRAVLLTARAMAMEDNDRDAARALALEAVKLAPDLVPAAAMAGRFLGEANELRKAGRMVEAAWRANPHPDLAETYAHLRVSDSARERLTRVQSLAQKTPGDVEGPLAVARAALDAQEFAIAREALAPLAITPTQRVAMLMAELAQSEHGDEGRAREWMTRALRAPRDPAWTADGVVSDRWMPVSPVTGRLDAFEWRVPLAELASASGAVIEARDSSPVVIEPVQAVVMDEPAASPPGPEPDATHEITKDAPLAPEETPAPRRRRSKAAAPDAHVEKVIPLVRAPDDPGPEPELPPDPEVEPAPGSDGWRRLRELFK